MARYIGRSTDGLPKNPGAQIRSQRNIDQIEDKTAFSAHGRSKRKNLQLQVVPQHHRASYGEERPQFLFMSVLGQVISI